jgi:hypothetical protein
MNCSSNTLAAIYVKLAMLSGRLFRQHLLCVNVLVVIHLRATRPTSPTSLALADAADNVIDAQQHVGCSTRAAAAAAAAAVAAER